MKSTVLSSNRDWVIGSRQLDGILELVEGSQSLWREMDLRELLQAQLDLPLPPDRARRSALTDNSPRPAKRFVTSFPELVRR